MIACVHKKASNTVSTDSNNEDTIALSNVEKDSSTCTNSEFFMRLLKNLIPQPFLFVLQFPPIAQLIRIAFFLL